MFAVVKIAGKQYKVSPNDIVTVDRISGDAGAELTFSDVLMMDSDGKVAIGSPLVKGVIVKAKIVEQTKGEKLNVRRYKSKVRHRRSIGFRSQMTKLSILSVGKA